MGYMGTPYYYSSYFNNIPDYYKITNWFVTAADKTRHYI